VSIDLKEKIIYMLLREYLKIKSTLTFESKINIKKTKFLENNFESYENNSICGP